jgi:hypothetical protein
MIWSVVFGAAAYVAIASAGYETARQEGVRHSDPMAAILHIIGLLALIASIYLAANSN